MNKNSYVLMVAAAILAASAASAQETWKPNTDWGHWRLGHKTDLEFLEKNKLTITFGSGAPNFETVGRKEFDEGMEKAKAFNKGLHDKRYIVLRYLSSSINGVTETGESTPAKDQINLLRFFREKWQDYADYVGPRPSADPRTWITVRPDGSFPFYRYAPYGQKTGKGFETWGCPNNPDYARMMEGRVRAQAETGIDGSYIDWTQIAGGTCYCNYCRSNFIAYLETNLPREASAAKYGVSDYRNIRPPEKRGDKFWMEWITFRGHSVAEFHHRMGGVARRYNPHFMISGNVFGGFGYGAIAYDAAGNIEMLGRDGYDDFVYSEIQEFLDSAPRKNDQGTKISNGAALKFLAAATHGKPVVVYATEITPPVFPNPTEQCLSAMAQINIAEAAANHCVFREKRETPPGATRIYRFLAANEDKLSGGQLYGNVAVLASLNQYLADELSFAFSASRVMSDRGMAHIMMVEDDLVSGKLEQFDLIVLPYLPLLSVEKQKALVRYVERGGRLLVLGQCGAKDEHNVPNKGAPLAGLFGGAGYPERETVKKAGQGRAQFLPLEIPASRFLIPMKAKGEYTTFGPTMADVFADIPEGYTRNRIDPALRKMLERVADQAVTMLGGRVTRLAGPAPYVEITSMMVREKNCMLIHFVNYDVTVDGVITPARNLKVEVALPRGTRARSVSYNGSLAALTPVKFSTAGRKVSFPVDELGIYGLAVVEME